MKEKYETIEFEIVEFESEDVITSSINEVNYIMLPGQDF